MQTNILSRLIKLTLTVLCFTFFTAVQAQKKPAADATVKTLTDSMKLKLALTDAQYAKVYQVNSDFAAKLKAVKATNEDKEVKKDKAKELNKEWSAALKNVLTAEQFKKFDDNKKEEKKQLKKVIKSKKATP
jgi:uncharacterized protein YciW